MPKILLIGGGGHCRSVIDVIESQREYSIFGIVDSNPDLRDVLGYPNKGSDHELAKLLKECSSALITIGQLGNHKKRADLYEKVLALGFTFPTIVSSRAYVSKHAKIGPGTVVMHDVIVNAGASVGSNCILNTKALIEHDARVEDHCHISTAAVINGGVRVGRGSFFGSNAVSKQYITIADESFTKAGAVVK